MVYVLLGSITILLCVLLGSIVYHYDVCVLYYDMVYILLESITIYPVCSIREYYYNRVMM